VVPGALVLPALPLFEDPPLLPEELELEDGVDEELPPHHCGAAPAGAPRIARVAVRTPVLRRCFHMF